MQSAFTEHATHVKLLVLHFEALVLVHPLLLVVLQVPHVPELQYGVDENWLQSESSVQGTQAPLAYFAAVTELHPVLLLATQVPELQDGVDERWLQPESVVHAVQEVPLEHTEAVTEEQPPLLLVLQYWQVPELQYCVPERCVQPVSAVQAMQELPPEHCEALTEEQGLLLLMLQVPQVPELQYGWAGTICVQPESVVQAMQEVPRNTVKHSLNCRDYCC